jgi:folate-binding protein YgfZ
MYCELRDAGLIRVSGPDAATFLHTQLTSDVLGMHGERIQWSGYCSPKGRLLATLILWRTADEILLQLPVVCAAATRMRLAKYVLRSRVTLSDASESFRLHGVAGPEAQTIATTLVGAVPGAERDVVARNGLALARLSSRRALVLSPAADPLDPKDFGGEREMTAGEWARMDIEDGVPWITPESEDRFVPQMVNLDLLGGVSFSKGCYPGQEIVARTHYLGRLKQRMYRVKLRGDIAPAAGDPLYSPRFGADQACGTLLNVAHAPDEGHEALAVIRMESARDGAVHWKDLARPAVEFLPLPYPLPD